MVAGAHALSVACLAVAGVTTQAPVPATLAPDSWRLTAEQQARLVQGDVIVVGDLDGNAGGEVRAAVRIDAPAESIWLAMTDCGRALEFVPHLESCRVLDSAPDGSWQLVEHSIDYRWYLPRTDYVFRADYRPFARIDVSHVSGDFREHQAVWELEPAGSGADAFTIVKYRVRMVPRFYVPRRVVRASLRRDLPSLLRALRSHSEQGAGNGRDPADEDPARSGN